MNENKKEWLTPAELETEYSFPRSSQAKLRMYKKIPFIKIGRSVRYKRSQIEEWLEQHQVI